MEKTHGMDFYLLTFSYSSILTSSPFRYRTQRSVYTKSNLIMNNQLLAEASKLFPDTQVLINMVSKRVRELSHGHRPMVDPGLRSDFSDIALSEIIAGKLGHIPATGDVFES